MRKIFATALIALAAVSAMAQPAAPGNEKKGELTFTTIKENPITPIKNQYRSGTCWCFSGLAFLESKAIRINGIKA